MGLETFYVGESDIRSFRTNAPLTIPEPAPKIRVGARCLDYTSGRTLQQEWAVGISTFGNLGATRSFADVTRAYDYITPVGVDEIPSYKDTGTNPVAFVNSLRGANPLLAFYHEPEGPNDFADGPTFVNVWSTQRDKVKAIRPEVQYGMIAGGYQYRNSSLRGWSGSFIPPDADFYMFDTYRLGIDDTFNAVLPLTSLPEFNRWLTLVGDKGKPLGISEYGRGLVGQDANRRNDVIAEDYEWLKANGFSHWIFWWSNRDAAANQQWRFTETSTKNLWASIVAAENGA